MLEKKRPRREVNGRGTLYNALGWLCDRVPRVVRQFILPQGGIVSDIDPTAARRLVCALIVRAVQDASGKNQEMASEAREFLEHDQVHSWLGTLDMAGDMNPDEINRRLLSPTNYSVLHRRYKL